MKKFLSIILVFVICLGLVACREPEKPENNVKEKFKSKVTADVAAKCKLSYSNVKNVITTISTVDVSGDTYTAEGKVAVIDNNGDRYEGKVTAVYKYYKNSNSFAKSSLDIEQPRKK